MKTVIITGATKGIGLETSLRLHKKGWQVVGLARNSQANFPGELFLCDLSDLKQTETMLKAVSKKYQADAVINNVGLVLPQLFGEVDFDSLQAVYNLNVRTALQVTQHFLSDMRAKAWGRIVNVVSRAIYGAKKRTSYSAAKSALVGFTKTWAVELAKEGITVNAIAPGPVETESFRQNHPRGSEAEQNVLNHIPMGRIGKPEEIAVGIEFLLAEEAGFITGQVISIDGGGSLITRA
ncbi:MAG: short-chain dehydrogenase [Gammaproteobacteria bacterium RIFCSPHIGHO2_12_FULL_35_23]|nr:MAG: short-chain dehydrogenase [Gammaproteobacteria bacterium RIFCSPHIGHO2_12_FULL_35_23]